MNEPIIAIVFDFDGTLGPDTITTLLTEQKVNQDRFWSEVSRLVKDEWDPPFAYMHLLSEYARQNKLDLSTKRLQQVGKKLQFFPGLPTAFDELQNFVSNHEELRKTRISLEFYIISGGIEEIIRGSALAPFMTGIFGCNFSYDIDSHTVTGIKSAISFTEKTRYLYGINKGISTKELRTNPYKINDAVSQQARRIPFSQMIYIGDGPSDIPCLSAIMQYGGTGIGVTSPAASFKKGYELARGKRITVGPYTANYATGSDMRKVLEETILRIGLEIDVNKQKHVIEAPEMG
jgi:2-hydroxy-3-keto-5-methylthiopentenyl-1-phosphate phosphatase